VDLNTMMKDPNLPKLEEIDDFFPVQLDAAGRFVDKDKVYALPYDAPTMIWQYRKDLFEKYGDRMKQDLGCDPTP
jgi:multiple sugar transport system substrate-binding protein